MNCIIRSIPMVIILSYFFYLWGLASLVWRTRLAFSFRWNFFLSANIASALVLTSIGLARFVYGMQSSWILFTISLLLCLYLTIKKHKVTGKRYVISLLISLWVVAAAAIVPAGIIELHEVGVTFPIVWRSIVILLLITILTFGFALNEQEKQKKRIIKNNSKDKSRKDQMTEMSNAKRQEIEKLTRVIQNHQIQLMNLKNKDRFDEKNI